MCTMQIENLFELTSLITLSGSYKNKEDRAERCAFEFHMLNISKNVGGYVFFSSLHSHVCILHALIPKINSRMRGT